MTFHPAPLQRVPAPTRRRGSVFLPTSTRPVGTPRARDRAGTPSTPSRGGGDPQPPCIITRGPGHRYTCESLFFSIILGRLDCRDPISRTARPRGGDSCHGSVYPAHRAGGGGGRAPIAIPTALLLSSEPGSGRQSYRGAPRGGVGPQLIPWARGAAAARPAADRPDDPRRERVHFIRPVNDPPRGLFGGHAIAKCRGVPPLAGRFFPPFASPDPRSARPGGESRWNIGDCAPPR